MLLRTSFSLFRRSARAVAKFDGGSSSSNSAIASVLIAPRLLASTSSAIIPTFDLIRQRNFSSSSHDDFAPKREVVDGEDEATAMIKQHVTENPVMLYMKGNPSMPMCGFSAKTVQALQAEGIDFSSVNVLDYPSVREAVKKYSEWPTIPQLYVNGEFIGGCDIVSQMAESGELKEILAEAKSSSD